MEYIYVDKTASYGVASAPVYVYAVPDLTPDTWAASEIPTAASEMEKFDAARESVINDLRNVAGEDEIFAAHLEIADDILLRKEVEDKIKNENKNAQSALCEVISEFAASIDGTNDSYLRERAADIRDVGKRLMAALKGVRLPDLGGLTEPHVVAAKNLYPSDTVKMDPKFVRGILTEEGGVTSHVSILAKSLGIPALFGVKNLLSKVKDGDMVCMDAERGCIVLQPDKAVIEEYRMKADSEIPLNDKIPASGAGRDPVPVLYAGDGRKISVCVNVGKVQEIRQALNEGIDGVGLFRTELLYMSGTHFPTEEEQFEVYKKAAELVPDELTIRTLDIGSDKILPYYMQEKEENPALGWRGIRVSLDEREMFHVQLRAILRAGAYGHIRILFPMICSAEEFAEAKKETEECMHDLSSEGFRIGENIEMGVMIETPASIMLADELAEEADFFSIGTNDLTQYMLAADRGSKKLAEKFDYFHPAVIKAVSHAVEAGHRAGIKVGMCGEMASDLKAVKMLFDMGIDEFSMSAGSIRHVRERLMQLMH